MADTNLVMAVSDFTKLPAEIIVDLINYDNGTTLTTNSLSFGLPSPITGERNTQVTATALAGSYYTGSVNLTYNRIDLLEVPGVRSKVFEIAYGATIADIIPDINLAYAINLTVDDFVDGLLPDFTDHIPNEEKTFELVANSKSLIFINSVVLSAVRRDVELSTIITKTMLSGLVYIQPVA